ncbi:pyridoxal phosphate-dependent decarboxylase family protein [Nonomuraea basaltis]|uniref:pyridoxal phosphate-dependent decarboxylase family protein n=1 Tax=Nonomuraea basaltis TaxID=2495887 RepID=UPI00110C409F|nr:pyridoxal-dependent decarboxylase [Nonomuraea basaltis]TMR97075.1 pyridoxal-dependent decarboxylase [Nonomuraea basaltis]
MSEVRHDRSGPGPAGGYHGVAESARALMAGPLLPELGGAPHDVLADVTRAFAAGSVDLTHPAALARMQPPSLAVAAAAELVVATLNQSLHAWESGPFALEIERFVTAELATLIGYGSGAGGTLTSGGSVSNLMAMTMARDSVLARRLSRRPGQEGVAGLHRRPVVLAQEAIHFSIGRALRILGIGEDQLIPVAVDADGRTSAADARRVLFGLPGTDLPLALVALAGSTDLGVIDPLRELAEVAREHDLWLHADAAYGAGALFSERLRPLLDGLSEADSVTMDLHKFGWLPSSSAMLLVKSRGDLQDSFGLATTTCLTSADDTEQGYHGLQGESLQTTRRADAFKILVALRCLGRERLSAMVDACHDLAIHAAERIREEPRLELVAHPPLGAVLFRYLTDDPGKADEVNGAARRELMATGRLLLARTHLVDGAGVQRVYLKLLFLNPETAPEQVDDVIAMFLTTARRIEAEG